MSGLQDFVTLDNKKYAVDPRTATRGIQKPYLPQVATGDEAYSTNTWPFTSKGQSFWSGLQQKFAKPRDNVALWQTTNVDLQYRDRALLANSFSATVKDTAITSVVKFAQFPFKDLMFARSEATNEIWYKSGAGAWTAVDFSAISWTGATPTGWTSDVIGTIAGGSYILFGSKNGHVLKVDGTPTATEVGRPSSGSDNLQGGIYAMAMYDGVPWIAGATSGSAAILAAYDGTTMTTKFKADAMNGASRVNILLRRYVDADQNPNQLHFVAVNTGSTTGDRAWHFMYDGEKTRELRHWADSYPMCAIEYDVVGARGLLFGMSTAGQIWRFTGDYQQILRLDAPETAYGDGIYQLVQFGRFVAIPIADATNGASILFYDGQGFWQGPSLGSDYIGAASAGTNAACGLGAYRNTLFLAAKKTTNTNKVGLTELNTGTTYATSGKIITSAHDGGARETPKDWLRVRLHHEELAASESIQVEYQLEGATVDQILTYSEDFRTTAFQRPVLTTAHWDTANGQLAAPGAAAQTFTSKIAGSVTQCAHSAYEFVRVDGTLFRPREMIDDTGTELTQAKYNNLLAVDASVAQTVTAAGSATVYQTTEGSTWSDPAGLRIHAFTFTTTAAGLVATLAVKAKLSGTGSATLRARVVATSSGEPSGIHDPLGSATATVTSTTGETVTFTFADPIALDTGTVYAVVLDRQDIGVRDLTLRIASASAASVHYTSLSGGLNWVNQGDDLYFVLTVYDGSDPSLGGPGSPYQLYVFDLGAGADVVAINPDFSAAAYTAGPSAGTVTLRIWNGLTQSWSTAWDSGTYAATGTAQAALSPLLTTNVNRYVTATGQIYLLVGGSGTTLDVDMAELNAYYTQTATWGYSTAVDTANANITGTVSLTSTVAGGGGVVQAYISRDGGSTWSAAQTLASGTNSYTMTPGGTGSDLRWKISIDPTNTTATPTVTALSIVYTAPASGWQSLGTNSTRGSTFSEFYFGDTIAARLLSLRFTLSGPGTTSPVLTSYALDYVLGFEFREVFQGHFLFRQDEDLSDDTIETRSPLEQYQDVYALMRGHRKPSMTWIDGGQKSQVILLALNFLGMQKGGPTEDDDEYEMRVPFTIVAVRD